MAYVATTNAPATDYTALANTANSALSGFLGRGRMEMLEHVGADVWALPCPRALDHTPPGDWTLNFMRNPSGTVTGIELGCWLARHLMYRRID